MIKKCSKCEVPFTCQNESRGCWCEDIQLSTQVLTYLKDNYDNCLCSKCLQEFQKLNETPNNLT
ncbi:MULTISPECIES: cysteine-rich CWC family protein [Niastella]|uniref:Cysteine-rich CWC family protein n=1 Tax=Niastella soli TaxID=2821487 RepID=A0ABS3Z3R9_9BACT|nr:cysteine-rich CWC family protein [Niastella soli]